MDQGDPTEADHHDMLMKPKGINIFQTDLMKSENDSQVMREASLAPAKLGVNGTPPSLAKAGGSAHLGAAGAPYDSAAYTKQAGAEARDQQELQTILDQKRIQEYVSEGLGADKKGSPEADGNNPQMFATGDGSGNAPQTSFFTSSMMKEDGPENAADLSPLGGKSQVLEGEDDSRPASPSRGAGMIPQHGPGSVRKLKTLNPKKKRAQQVGATTNENQGGHKVAMVDIDNVQYTENSSNANSVNKSEIMRQMDARDRPG